MKKRSEGATLQSPFDPDASCGHKGPGYSLHIAETGNNTGKTEIITDYEVHGAARSDMGKALGVIERLDAAELKPEILFADGGYPSVPSALKVVPFPFLSFWTLRMDPNKPLESIAYKTLVSYPLVSCVSLNKRLELIRKAVRDYRIDGAILHSNRSCKPISMGQMDIQSVLLQELSVPSIMFDGDHMDEGKFSMAQFQTRIDAFMEMLLHK